MQQDAKQVILGGVQEILEDCKCGDPTCPRAFSLAKTPLEFTEKLLTTYRKIVNGQNMMMAELCDAVIKPEPDKLYALKIKLGEQGERCTMLCAAINLIMMAILVTPQDQSVGRYRVAIAEKAAEIASKNYNVMVQEVQTQEKETMN